MNVWRFEIAFVGSGDDAWEQAKTIVGELERDTEGPHGVFWIVEYGATEESRDQAAATVEQELAEISDQALELLRVTPPS